MLLPWLCAAAAALCSCRGPVLLPAALCCCRGPVRLQVLIWGAQNDPRGLSSEVFV